LTSLSTTLIGSLHQLWARLSGNSPVHKRVGDEPPLRSELFSASQMEQHGKTLAAAHTLSADHTHEQLLTRLGENEDVLHEVRDLLTEGRERKPEDYTGRGMAP
jgi:cyclic beta-1,2-glucan synthetase